MSRFALHHAVNIDADVEKVRDALTTQAGLQGWTGAQVSGAGDVGSNWTLKYANGPTFTWAITANDANKVSWRCVAGPGDSAGTTATYEFAKSPDGRTRLEFTHDGWPHQQGNFTKCNTLWGMILHHLREFTEHGTIAPAHS